VAGRKAFAATGGVPFDTSKRSVVFLHGAGLDHTVWALQSRYFAQHGKGVLALDLPGHGRSEGPPPQSIEAYADWLLDLLAAAGIEEISLVGHSMGALIALEAAARLLERVRSLALLGVTPRMPVHPELLEAASRDDPHAIELIIAWGYGTPAHLGGHKGPGLWLLGGGKRLLERAGKGVLASDFRACDAYEGAILAAHKVKAPTLLLMGELDRMTPAKAAIPFLDVLPDAESEVIPDAGHMLMLERPDATLAALRKFLR